MIRRLSEHIMQNIDPWAFARNREVLRSSIPISQTRELGKLADKNAAILFTIEGDIDGENHSYLSGKFEVELNLECQRCLSPMKWPLAATFKYLLLHNEAQEHTVEEGSETLICADDHLDLAWFLEEEVLLSIPMIAKHDSCAAPAYIVEESAPEPEKDNPFAALKNLINNKEQP